jgi:hypothetical protein
MLPNKTLESIEPQTSTAESLTHGTEVDMSLGKDVGDPHKL